MPWNIRQQRLDMLALVSITLIGLLCHLAWDRMPAAVVFASTAVIIILLSAGTAWLWKRLALRLTRFFCVAAILDLAAEGILRPYHGDAASTKLVCQLTLFAAYGLYLIALRPLDVWLASRRRVH